MTGNKSKHVHLCSICRISIAEKLNSPGFIETTTSTMQATYLVPCTSFVEQGINNEDNNYEDSGQEAVGLEIQGSFEGKHPFR
jgi:hypothetical protein